MKNMDAFQSLLLRLYTHKPTLETYIQDRDAVLSEYPLSERQQQAVFGIPVKALQEFQQQLFRKKLGVVRKVLRKSGNVVAIPFHPVGTPVLMWSSQEQIYSITPGMFLLFEQIAHDNKLFTLKALLTAFNEVADTRLGFWDLFKSARLMYSKNLISMNVISM